MLNMMRVAYPNHIQVRELLMRFGHKLTKGELRDWQAWFDPLLTTSTLEDYGKFLPLIKQLMVFISPEKVSHFTQ